MLIPLLGVSFLGYIGGVIAYLSDEKEKVYVMLLWALFSFVLSIFNRNPTNKVITLFIFLLFYATGLLYSSVLRENTIKTTQSKLEFLFSNNAVIEGKLYGRIEHIWVPDNPNRKVGYFINNCKIIKQDNGIIYLHGSIFLDGYSLKEGITIGDTISIFKVALKPGRIYGYTNSQTLRSLCAYKSWPIRVDALEGGIIRLAKEGFFRHKIHLFLLKSMSRKGRAFLEGLVWGDVSGFNMYELSLFRVLGLTHLLAVSGMNMAGVLFISVLIVTAIYSFCVSIKIISYPRMLLILCFLLGGVYLILANFQVGLVRAFIMMMFSLLAGNLYPASVPMQGLFVAGWFLLIKNPASMLDHGFALSFLCSGLLVFALDFYGFIRTYLQSKVKHGIVNYFFSMFFVSLFVTFGLIPYLSYNFGEAPLTSSLFNVIFVPITELALFPIALTACLLIPINEFFAYPFVRLFDILSIQMIHIMEFFASQNWVMKSHEVLSLSFFELNLFYVLLAVFLFRLRRVLNTDA